MPATDYVEPPANKTLHAAVHDAAPRRASGAQTMMFLEPTAASSTNTMVAAPDACASNILDFQATLGDADRRSPRRDNDQVARRLEPDHQGQLRQHGQLPRARQRAGRLLPGQDRRRSADELHRTSSRSRPRCTRCRSRPAREVRGPARRPRRRAARTAFPGFTQTDGVWAVAVTVQQVSGPGAGRAVHPPARSSRSGAS